MNEGQSPINIFQIGNQGATPQQGYGVFNQQATNQTMGVIQQGQQNEMDRLDEELRQQGLLINKMADDDKKRYVNSLTNTQYQRMLQYKNAGYSFEASKALVDMEKQQVNGGGYRGEGFQLAEPLGGKNSVWNRANPVGRATEFLDDLIQKIPDIDVKGSLSKKLTQRINNLTEEERKEYEERFNNLSSAMKKYYGNVDTFIEEQNKSFIDTLFGADTDPTHTGPNLGQMIANSPVSALKTFSATVRGITNPLDTIVMLKDLIATPEGREIIKTRYGSWDGFQQALEYDRVGVASDVLAVAEAGGTATGLATKGAALGTRLAGATNTAAKLSRAGGKILDSANVAGIASDLGVGLPHNAILNNVLGKMANGGPVSNVAGSYISLTQRPLRTIWAGANPNGGTAGNFVFPGIEKKVSGVVDSIRDRVQTAATGLTPEVKERIRQNPYIKDYWDRIEQMINDEGAPMDNQRILEGPIQEVGEELLRRLEEYEAKLQETGPEYATIRAMQRPYNFSDLLNGVYRVFDENGISVGPDDELVFSRTANPADMNPIKTAWNIIKNVYPQLANFTPKQLLDLRMQLRSLINYESDTRATRYSKKVLQGIVDGELNKLAHKEIPGLKEIDKAYSTQLNELKKFKDGLVYQVGEKRGQIKDNFYSIIKTIGTQNRQKMKARLEELYPDLGLRVEAINMLPKVAKAYQDSPSMMKALFKTAGIMGGLKYGGGPVKTALSWVLGIVADELLSKPLGEKWRKMAIDELMKETSPEAQQALAEIHSKVQAGIDLTEAEKKTLATAVQEIALSEKQYLDEKALEERQANEDYTPYFNDKDYKYRVANENILDQGDTNPYGFKKMIGEMTPEKKKRGLEVYGLANEDINNPTLTQAQKENIDIARKTFIILNQQVGYTEKLGLNQGEVNARIEERTRYSEGVKDLVDSIHKGADQKNWWMGIDNLSAKLEQVINSDALKTLVRKIEGTTPNSADERAIVETIMAINGHNDYRLLAIEFLAFEDTRLRKTEAGEVRGYYNRKEDKMYVREDMPYTIEHEIGHFIDYLWGRELFGKDVYASDLGANYDGVDGRVKRFHQEFESFIDDLVDSISEEKKNDMGTYRVNEDGSVEYLKDYRTKRDEVFARFVNAFVEWTKRVANGGMTEKNRFGISEQGDEFTVEQFMRFAELIQGKTKLYNNGLLKTAETPKGGKKIDINKIAESYTKTPEELEHKAGKMIETWGDAVRGFDIDVMLDKFDPDFRKWQKRVEKVKGKDNMYSDNDFMDFFLTLKAMSKDPEFMEGLRLRAERIKKAQENGTAYGSENVTRLYDMLSRKDLKLTAPKGQRDIDVVNEELLEPIRRWLIQSGITRSSFRDIFATLGANYSPDTIQWQNNLEKSAGRDFKRLKVKDLKELEGYIKDLIEKGEVNAGAYDPILGSRRYSQYTINGEMPDRLIDVVERGIGDTFTDKRIKEVANDMWDTVMDPMGDIFKDALVGGQHIPPSELNEFYGKIYYAMGETYTTDMKERTRAVNEEIKKIGNEMGIALNRDRVVPEQKLQGLNAKLKELLAVGPDLGEYIVSERNFDYNPTRSEWIRDLVKGAYERTESNVAQATTEATKQLVALSNMDVDNFEKQIKNFGGKSPMPSIAVTDVNVPHTAFGDLTLVFGRETVDPQADPRNKIYASDAWTTTFPDIKDAGGFTFDNAKELRGLIEDKITSNVDSLTLTEVGLDLATRESLENKIVNEILNNAYDTEYLKGWQDVGDTTVENAVDELGLDRYENEGLYQDLQNLVADYVRQHQPTQVIPGYYFKGQVRYDDHNAVSEVVDKIYDNLTEKGIQKLKDDGWNFDESDQKYVINQRYKDTPPKQGIQRDIDDIVERITDYPNLTPTEAGKEFVNLLTEDYGFEENGAYEMAESIFGDIRGDQITLQEFVDDVRGQLPDREMIGMEDADLYQYLGLEVQDILKRYGGDWSEQRKVSKQERQNMADEIRDMYENFIDIDNRQKITGVIEKKADDNFDPMDEIERLGKAEELFEMTTKSMEKYPGEEIEKLIDEYADKITKKATKDRPLTAENVLEAMRNQGGPRRDVTEGSLRDLVGVEGKEFTDIEQVRKKNLAKTTHDDRTGDLSAIEKRYDTIIDEIRREFTEGEPDIPMEMSSQAVKQEIAWSYDPDLETFKNNLLEENDMWDIIPDDYLQAIIDCVEMGKQVPVRFSESKPERIVDLYKEVEYILVPKQDLGKVNEIVKGTPLEGKVHMYDRSGFKSERSDRMKSLQKKYGNIFFSMGGIVMPIAMLLMMVNQQEEGQA